MTKSTGVGRGKGGGGAKPGAGRPRKLGQAVQAKVAKAPKTETARIKTEIRKNGIEAGEKLGFDLGWGDDEVRALVGMGGKPRRQTVSSPTPQVAPVAPAELDPEETPADAASLVGVALNTLKVIMRSGPQDGPRVAAAKEVLRRAEAEAIAKGVGSGKKAAARANAHARVAEGGRFAPPSAPSSVVPFPARRDV